MKLVASSAGSIPAPTLSPMNIEHFNFSLWADSKEDALQKIKENLIQEDEEMCKLDLSPNLDEAYFKSSEAKMRYSFQDSDFWTSLDVVFSASESDKKTARRIYETLHHPLEDQAVSFKPDDRGRITLGSNYSDMDEVQVIILDE